MTDSAIGFNASLIKILIVKAACTHRVFAGRETLTNLNFRTLRDIFPKVKVISVNAFPTDNFRSIVKKYFFGLLGWLDGLDHAVIERCIAILKTEQIDLIYIEGSNYGRLAKYISLAIPTCRIVTFFHNVESRFFFGSLRSSPSTKALGVLIANWFAERLAVKYSDKIICLNKRDSDLLLRLYGRGATDIHPLCIADADSFTLEAETPRFGIFVGGSFYANVQGVRWFAKNVAPKISCSVLIIGKGFEDYRSELEVYKNIRVIGTVESVTDWYQRASFAVAPIFDGSGMKTKVAEALMYGRPIFGTAEAFVGYEEFCEVAGRICNDAESFVREIELFLKDGFPTDPRILRNMFEENFSPAAKERRFAELFGDLAKDESSGSFR